MLHVVLGESIQIYELSFNYRVFIETSTLMYRLQLQSTEENVTYAMTLDAQREYGHYFQD